MRPPVELVSIALPFPLSGRPVAGCPGSGWPGSAGQSERRGDTGTLRLHDRLDTCTVRKCVQGRTIVVQAELVRDDPFGSHPAATQRRDRPVEAVGLGERTL